MKIQLLCLLLFSTSVLGQINDRYKKFITQHIINEMSVNRCDDVIRSRGISMTDRNGCKETNTFILSTTKPVRAICGRAGEPHGTMTRSLQPFHVIVCQLRNQSRYPRCEYRGRSSTSYIAISCEQGFPVHYDRDIVVIN